MSSFLEKIMYESLKTNNLRLKIRKKLYPILITIIKLRNHVNGYHHIVLGDERGKTDKPKIFAITHIGKADIEVVSEVIKEHYYLLSGDFDSLKGTMEGLFLCINGVIYFNEKDKKDRHDVKKRMVDVLGMGGNIMYFPEGTWNLSANLPVNPLYMGIVDVALKSNAIIIPIAIEQYGKQFISKVGKNLDVISYGEENREEALTELRNRLATLKWEIWKSVSPMVREKIPNNYYERFIEEKLSEWPTLTLKDFSDAVYKNIYTMPPDEVFAPIRRLECRKETAFLFDKRNIGTP